MSSATAAAKYLGAKGGAAGTGKAKRRGDSEYYRKLAEKRWGKAKGDTK